MTPGSGKIVIKHFVASQDVLDLSAAGLAFIKLDGNGDGVIGKSDDFVLAKASSLKIDLGAAMGDAPNVDVLVVKGAGSLGAENLA